MNINHSDFFPFLPALGPLVLLLIGLAIVWTLVIKGFALWKAARNGHKVWFVFILILNDLGILSLVYLIWFAKEASTTAPAPAPAPSSQI